ncbi:MAG: CDP-glycerol glycerophosphotransferase family protein [Spirochaetaceae bacterium]|jgi:hypothetical protein|nr:CDP-glycerol glycerophosphotransferase family protein [Spirochaetaceae bacterium]
MFYPLYIDPGTGSALFSILIAGAATVYFIARAFIIKLKVFFSGGKAVATATHAFVIYCEEKQYCNVFKPVIDEFERQEKEVLYLTSAEDDPVFSSSYRFVKSEFIGKGNKAFARLNFLSADIVLLTTPGLDVYQLKRAKTVKHYAHVLHMPCDATLYRIFGLDYFDSVLLSGDYQAVDIRTLEKLRDLPNKELITVGCPYLDVAAEKIISIPPEQNHPFTVLVSPSWGASALLSKYGERLLTPLIKTGWRIIVRPHPQSQKSESALLSALTEQYKNEKNLIWNYDRENIYALAKADIMISDFSGVIFDYVFLCDKPVMYINEHFDMRPYDADDLGEDAAEKLWQFRVLKEIGIELKESMFEAIGDYIKNASDSEDLRIARKRAKDTAWQYHGEAGRRIAEFMISKSQS